MWASKSFDNLLISNESRLESSHNSGFFQSLTESQSLKQSAHFKYPPSQFSSHQPIFSDRNQMSMSSSQRLLFSHDLQTPGKQSLTLERSKSQRIQPVYLLPSKNTLGDDLDQSKELQTSKSSQFTFSKPSEFIINTSKQNIYLENIKKNYVSHPKIQSDYYGVTFGNFRIVNPVMKESQNSLNSSNYMKQSYQSQNFSPYKNNMSINHPPQFIPQIRKPAQIPMQASNIYHQSTLPAPLIIKNPLSTGFTIRPSLRRCLSNLSISSQKSQNKYSQTKIKFNYISPTKSQSNKQRKISFKNQDVKNPLSKLSKKKEENIKVEKTVKIKNNCEVINQYFPESKVKKNKMKLGSSPKGKQCKVSINAKNYNQDENDNFDITQRSKTFIASLAALATLSDIKQVEKETSAKILPETQSKMTQAASEYLCLDSNPRIEGRSIKTKKIAGYRITLDGQKIPLYNSGKDEINTSIIRSSPFSKQVTRDMILQKQVARQVSRDSVKVSSSKKSSFPKQSSSKQLSSSPKEQSSSPKQESSRISSPISKQVYKDSQVSSAYSTKNGGEQFQKKFGNDSSHTTDYQDEISKKIKEQLGLHFSYFKKK